MRLSVLGPVHDVSIDDDDVAAVDDDDLAATDAFFVAFSLGSGRDAEKQERRAGSFQ